MKTVEIIKELMAEQGVNQTQLAERSGIAFGTLNRILNEKQSLQPNTLQKIAIALGISTFELLDEADSYPLLNNQVNGYLEFGGEIKRIRSFTELEVWVKRVKPLVGELPNRAKSIIRDNNKNSKLILSQSSAIHNFNDIDLCKNENYDATKYNCWSFRRSEDEREDIQMDLGNMCTSYPFFILNNTFHNSESAYICGMFSNNTKEHLLIQHELQHEQNGYRVKKVIRRKHENQKRNDWEEFKIQWMLYVIWQKCKSNEEFRKLLLSIPQEAIIIENSTRQRGKTADFWGARNYELEECRDIIANYIEFQNPYLKKKELDALKIIECNKINYIGKFVGVNCMGKILKLCQMSLINDTDAPINYEFLEQKKIYLLGKLLTFK